jgi:hypothetical protein
MTDLDRRIEQIVQREYDKCYMGIKPTPRQLAAAMAAELESSDVEAYE